ncbi:hypothetical protein COCOBI_11-4980 [Coccomyxa sp. Obi]|nr:hypothetical protein COCOBI_11-4980 [Coccomyxa sp. Obi]
MPRLDEKWRLGFELEYVVPQASGRLLPLSSDAHFQDLKAAYQQVQAQAPSSTGSNGELWVYVLPVQYQPRQLQDSEASAQPPFREAPAHPQQQQQRFGPHRSSDPYLDASSPQGPLHRLSADMSTSYQSPRQREGFTASPSKQSHDGSHQRASPSVSPLQGTPYDAAGGLPPHEQHTLAHAGRRTQDSTVRRGRPSVPALDLAAPQGNPPLLRRSARQISEGVERQYWSPMDQSSPWGPALPQSQPMPVDAAPAPYYTPTQPGGFGGGPLSGGYSPFQAVAHRPLGPPARGPEWAAQDLPRPPHHDPPPQQLLQSYDHHVRPQQQDAHWDLHGYMAQDLLGDRTPWNLEAAAQPPGGYAARGSERRPPLFSAVGRVPLSTGGLPSPEGGLRPRGPPAAPDKPFRARALTSVHSDADMHFQEDRLLGDAPPPFARVHPAHAAVLHGGGLRHAGSAPCELAALGQPPVAGADALLWDCDIAERQRHASAELLPRDSPFPRQPRGGGAAAAVGCGGWDSGPSVASAPAATTLSRAASSRGSSPANSPSNTPGTLLPSALRVIILPLDCLAESARQGSDEHLFWAPAASPDIDSARRTHDSVAMAGTDGRQKSSSSEEFNSLHSNVPEKLQRAAMKAGSSGNLLLQPDEVECMHTLGAALHRGLCLKDSYNRGFDSPVREFGEGGGSWGIKAGSGGGPAGRTGSPLEGDPAAVASTGAKQLVPLTVPNEGDEAQEPALNTPAQIPAQQKQLRHGTCKS